MTQFEKVLDKLLRVPPPSDMRWGELVFVLSNLGFVVESNDGSRRRFVHTETKVVISLHEPHPRPEIKRYVITQVVRQLADMGFIERRKR